MSNLKFAKPEDIKVGTKIGLYINGIVMFKGEVVEFEEGISIRNTKFVTGYFKWGESDSTMSFSVGENENTFILVD